MKRVTKFISASVSAFLLLCGVIGANTPDSDSNQLQTSSPATRIVNPSTSEKALDAQPADNPTPAESDEAVEPTTPEITTKTETKTITIPYNTTYADDNSLTKGTTKVVQEGVAGTREEIYTVTYTDGVETKRELTSSTITKQPVNQIIHNGTYIAPQQPACQNGTYINSNGQTVCRPSAQNTGGATAICRDGSYSYSKSRRGTCSHHGGVKTWL